jgi:hypothetical protein
MNLFTSNSKIMKTDIIKFIKKSLAFIIIIIFCVYILNYIYIEFILSKTSVHRITQEYNALIKGSSAKEFDFAAFGDSHTQYGIDPHILPNSFNFASRNYICSYYKLKKIINTDHVKINNIILEIDVNIFSSFVSGSDRTLTDPRDTMQYIPWDEMKKINNGSFIKLWLNTYLPSIGNGTQFIVLIKKEPEELTEIYRGWQKHDNNFALDSEDNKKVILTNVSKYFDNQEIIDNTLYEYFIDTIKLAKENNINIIFVKYPMTKDYDNMLKDRRVDKKLFYEKIFQEINLITNKKYNFLDYYNLFFNNPDYFDDSSHLNYKGSEILSNKILKDLSPNKK